MNARPDHASLNADKIALTRAIDMACAELQALRNSILPSEIREIQLQSESAQVYASYASDMLPIFGALIVEAVERAAMLAGHELSRIDRLDLATFDATKDILQDICGAAERLVEEEFA